jgi:uncharacterized membrane protein YhaH (DUF805 family)
MNPLKLLWSFYGRIGRLAHVGGLFLNIAWAVAAFVALIQIFGPSRTPGELPHPVVGPILIVGFILFIWAKFALSAKRFHDLGNSGWLSLLLIIPLFGFLVFLYLVFARGQNHDNAYGPARRQPPPLPQPSRT